MNIELFAMTGQLPEHWGKIGAICVGLLILYKTLYPYDGPMFKRLSPKSWDMIEMGVINRSEPGKVIHTGRKPKRSKETPERSEPKPEPKPKKKNDQFFDDCVKSLVVLGYKKSEAKSVTKSVLASKDISSLESFVVEACKK